MPKKNIGKNCIIHTTAIIEDGAVIGDNVSIGAYSIIDGNVKIGDNCEIKSHVTISGNTELGQSNKVFSFAAIGHIPQDLKYHGEESKIIIGDNNAIREHVTIHPGTSGDSLLTKVGSNCLLMVGVHIAHDCALGDGCILANNATLGGHVSIGDFAVLGGICAVHQNVRIGKHSMIGGMSGVEFDVIPYGVVMGNRARLEGLNIIGMKRRGFPRSEIHALRHFYQDVFENKSLCITDALKKVEKNYKHSEVVNEVIEFLRTESKRSLCMQRG